MRSKQNIEGTNKGGKKKEFLGMLGRFAISTKKECQMNYFLSYNLNNCRALFFKFLRQIVYIQLLLLALFVLQISLLASSCFLLFLDVVHFGVLISTLYLVALLLTFSV
jgi:hypothetical protein